MTSFSSQTVRKGVSFFTQLIFIRTLLTKMDHAIDAYPPTEWNERFGLAHPGDEACDFVRHFITDEIENNIRNYARTTQDTEKTEQDIYQMLNLAGMCLNAISDRAKTLHENPSMSHRDAYIEANEKLFRICTVFMFHPLGEVAGIVREATRERQDFDHCYHVLMERYPEEVRRGNAAKIAKDLRNWASELRMEREHGKDGFLKSNTVLQECETIGLSQEELYQQFKERFEKNKPIDFQELPKAMQQKIEDLVASYEDMQPQYAALYKFFGLQMIARQYNTTLKDAPGQTKTTSFMENLANSAAQLAGRAEKNMGYW